MPAERPSEPTSNGRQLAAVATVPRLSSGDQAALYIRRLIFDGHLQPGTRVPQDDVARALGLSRIPIREGLIALEREGWVTIELHRGAFINTLDPDTVRDHYALYGLMYGFAGQQALQRADTGKLVETLEPIARSVRSTTDPAAFTQQTVQFHRTVVDASHSTRVRVAIRGLSSLIPGVFFELVPDAMPIERRGLPAITRAFKAGDAERVAGEYQTMMRRVGEKVVTLFTGRGLFAGAGDA
jgi:DNA-binding GntR family transcriptional regulator